MWNIWLVLHAFWLSWIVSQVIPLGILSGHSLHLSILHGSAKLSIFVFCVFSSCHFKCTNYSV